MPTYSVSGDVATLTGTDHQPGQPAAVWIEASQPIILDASTGRLGGKVRLPLDSDGTFSISNLPATVAGAPLYRLSADSHGLRLSGKRQGMTTKWFPLEADRDLAWIVENYVEVTAISTEVAANVAAAAALGATNDTATASFVADPESATATALAARFGTRTLINIKDFGAVCDGTTNDTLAVRSAVAAVTALRAAGFARPSGILIPHGTARIEVNGTGDEAGVDGPQNTLVAVMIPSDFVVAGEGPTSVVKMTGVPATDYGGTGHNSLFGTEDNAHDIVFRDFTVKGENGTDGTGFAPLANNDSAAIDLGLLGNHDITIERVTFRDLRGFSIHARGPSERVNVVNCTTRYCANGINVNSDYSRLIGNTIHHSEGFECSGQGILITNNVFTDILGGAISAGGNYDTDAVYPGAVVSFNTIDGSSGAGITLPDAAHYAAVTSNTIRRTAKQGIIVASSGVNHLAGLNVIANNTVTDAGLSTATAPERTGIYVGGTSPSLVIGNIVGIGDDAAYDTYWACFVDGYATAPGPAGSTIIANRFRGSDKDLILDGGAATDVRIGDNDIVAVTISNGASAAQSVSKFDAYHEGVETFGHHIVTTTGAGGNFTAAANAGASSATRNSGTDTCGQVNYTTPGGTTGDLFTVTFGRAYATAPKVFLQSTDPKMAAAGLYVSSSSTTGFTVAATNAHAAGTMGCWFWVVGNS